MLPIPVHSCDDQRVEMCVSAEREEAVPICQKGQIMCFIRVYKIKHSLINAIFLCALLNKAGLEPIQQVERRFKNLESGTELIYSVFEDYDIYSYYISAFFSVLEF